MSAFQLASIILTKQFAVNLPQSFDEINSLYLKINLCLDANSQMAVNEVSLDIQTKLDYLVRMNNIVSL